MIRYILIFAITLATLSSGAQYKQWLDPTVASQGKEPARSAVRSYDSADGALRQSGESLYMQPLNGNWKVTTTGDETTCERDFKMPFAWVDRNVVLHLDAIKGAFEVFVNDSKVGYSQSTSAPSEFDIARYTNEGRNSLRIVVHNDHAGKKMENYVQSQTAEANRADNAASILGSDNYVISQPKVRVRDFVADTRMEGDNGLFSLGVIVKSHLLNNKELKVYYDLLSPEGKSVASGHRDAQFDMRGEDTVRFFANITDVKTWSHEAPNLYTLLIKTQHEGRFKEYMSFKVGFRTIDMVGGKMLINGKPIEMSVTQYDGNDSAELMRKDLTTMKERGVNCIKVKSHPLSASFYDLCDELGFYVCDQAALNSSQSGSSRKIGGNISNDPKWEKSYTDRVLRMFYNSKNHTSVVMFSIADNSANGYNLYQSYLALKRLERSRPVIYLGSEGEWNSDAERRVTFDPSRVHTPSSSAHVTISALDAAKGVFSISNNYILRPLYGAEVSYEVRARKRIVANGRIPISVGAEASTDVTIPLLKIKPGTSLTFTLKVEEPIVPSSYKPVKIETEAEAEQSRVQQGLHQGLSAIKSLTKSRETAVPERKVLAKKEFEAIY